MAYKALYRAYRPQTFTDVVDQKAIVKTLQNAIIHNKVGHAYLFCGPRGTGKTTLAKIFAKALNCEHGPTPNPCDECEVCKGITEGIIPDVIELDAASNNGADDIRVLRDSVKFLPSQCRYKVYIIDEVHMLSNAAFNALLKTLEEPPAYVVFILATTEPYKLPNTILSRCQRYDFQAISTTGIESRIRFVCEQEKLEIEDEAVRQISLASDGGMRDALSLLDQVISYIDNTTITVDDVLTISGSTSDNDLFMLLQSLYEHHTINAIDKLDNLLEQGKEVPKITLDLMNFIRDILMFKTRIKALSKPIFGDSSKTDLIDQIPTQVLYFWLDELNDALKQMRFSTQKRSYLDLAFLKMSDAKMREEHELIAKVMDLEIKLSNLENNIKAKENKIEVKPSLLINPQNKPIEDIKVDPEPVEMVTQTINDTNTIDIKSVEAILNNGVKDLKETFVKQWPTLRIKYADLIALNILFNGNVVACSTDGLLLVLQDSGFCERVMTYVNYIKILEILKTQVSSLTHFLAIPLNVWQEIRKDYKEQYDNGIKQPTLKRINIPVHLPVKPALVDEDQVIIKLKEIFSDDLRILEE